jgi:D-xylose transport system substrate-binding protein
VGPVPLSGQDASAAGIQNILLGNQTMTVYKPIAAEAEVAAKAALALCAGQDPSAVEPDFAASLSPATAEAIDLNTIGIKAADGKPADSPTGDGVVPYLALTPIGVTVDNIADTVIADNFRTIEEVCTGDTADTDFCKENS